jgi:hypothetical protein
MKRIWSQRGWAVATTLILARGLTHAATGGSAQAPLSRDGFPSCVVQVDGFVMMRCDAGGIGARECETRTEVSIGGLGYNVGCGVSCGSGTYACCQQGTAVQRAQCECEPNPTPGPWTPELPWGL